MKRMFFVGILLCAGAFIQAQQSEKTWNQWSKKDAEKILNNSAWGQTQTETDTSEMVFQPTAPGASSADRNARGATNQATNVKYRIRFLSAKPIRQAFARMVEIRQNAPDPQLSEQLRDFTERKFDDWVVVAVTHESSDQRFGNQAMQAFRDATAETLKNTTYLERKDGKRVFLTDYKPPINDGMGAKYIFSRTVDGQPFITADAGEVRFYSEMKNIKLNMRYKISNMIYNGALEY